MDVSCGLKGHLLPLSLGGFLQRDPVEDIERIRVYDFEERRCFLSWRARVGDVVRERDKLPWSTVNATREFIFE